MSELDGFDPAAIQYTKSRIAHWDAVSRRGRRAFSAAYHKRLTEVYRFLVAPEADVLELGCGRGELLAAVGSWRAVGVDFSGGMLAGARQAAGGIELIESDVHELSSVTGKFDVIIMSDLVNDLWDVQTVFAELPRLCNPWTRLILNFHSGLWQLPLLAAQKLGLAVPMLPQNWLTSEDVTGMLRLSGFEVIRRWHEVLLPIPLAGFFNKVLVRLWPFHQLALANFMVARPQPEPAAKEPSISVVIPARNESGNIRAIFERIPPMGRETELIFVEGHSHDDTYATVQKEIARHPEIPARLFRQEGVGKADAVRRGFTEARGDILMILDADLTVRPEELPRFVEALRTRRGEFINGVRLVYPMEKQAMRGLNLVGNKLFSLCFSWILGQPLKDTLCGTKALWRNDYVRIEQNRAYFGEFDPFGDFDLIFGAAKLSRKILDLPIRYRERTYGSTNISRWTHGVLLLRMVLIAAARLKFV